jgi:SAM-dependent methyltransferase
MIEIWHSQVRSTRESRLAYEDIYSGQGIRQPDSFYLWLLSLVNPSAGSKLLDVSCGEGALVDFARRRGVRAVGTDFSNSAAQRAKSRTHWPDFVVADGTELPFPDESFDHVTCIGSLEHFLDPESGVKEMRRIMGPRANACILLPNTFSLLGNVNYARKCGDAFDDGQPIQRYNSRLGWQRLIETGGLRVDRVHKWELTWPLTAKDGWWYVRRPRKLAHLLIGMAIPTNLANCLVYLCTKG